VDRVCVYLSNRVPAFKHSLSKDTNLKDQREAVHIVSSLIQWTQLSSNATVWLILPLPGVGRIYIFGYMSMLFPEFPSLIDSFMRTIRSNLNGLRVKLGRANEFFGACRCERRAGFMCVDSSWSRNDKFLLPLSFTLARSFDLALRTRKRQRPHSSLFKYSLNVVSPPLRSTNDGDAGDLQIREPDALLRAPLSPARTNF